MNKKTSHSLNALTTFVELANQSIECYSLLDNYWRDTCVEDLVVPDSEKNVVVKLLKTLILSRIEIANSFELLIRLDHESALEIIESRYLGDSVCPYSKYGGYQFELSILLSDYLEIRGPDNFKEELLKKYLDSEKLNDRIVRKAFYLALSCESDEFDLLIGNNKT